MKTFFKSILIIVLVIIAFPLVTGLFIEKDYAVEKQIKINRPVAEVFDYVVHIKHLQEEWGTWVDKDPNAQHTYTGTDGTVGFTASWKSENPDVGAGTQEITNIIPNERVDIEISFTEPFESKSPVYFTTEAQDGGTLVKWGMKGHMPYPTNSLLLFMDLEQMIGKDFQEGLGNLKEVMEQ
ncbi:SRPBCC family protein [Persicobacter psychrovividus]|uniref:Potassium-transporting ATPase subunit F n=1 Tax=Persicobacter psychrovividus TaxID=387638 RepID=A0ABM7VAW1_9BACT|nr:potassium-transporting ATPase subunit F [Persicobacter psychrovividus]